MTSTSGLSKPLRITSWVLQLIIVAIFAMTSLTKLTGAEEARHIFTTLGAEPWGRYLVGIAELAALVMLLIPRITTIGAIVSVMLMVGAIGSHVTKLGVSVTMPDGSTDGGAMFGMAVLILLAGIGIALIRRRQLPLVGGLQTRQQPAA